MIQVNFAYLQRRDFFATMVVQEVTDFGKFKSKEDKKHGKVNI